MSLQLHYFRSNKSPESLNGEVQTIASNEVQTPAPPSEQVPVKRPTQIFRNGVDVKYREFCKNRVHAKLAGKIIQRMQNAL